jgi:hypothetical protein
VIRLRTTKGAVVVLPEDTRFVELCDMDGQVAQVFYRDAQGVFKVVGANSPEAERYARLMTVKFIPLSSL